MMSDPRIDKYREAALAMSRGQFEVDVPLEPEDSVAELGRALRQLAEATEARFQEINTLVRVTERINAGVMLEEVLNHVFETFRPIIPYVRIGLTLLEEEGRTLRAVWSRTDAARTCLPAGFTSSMEGSSLQRIIDTGRPRILNDLLAYQREHPESEATRLIVEEGIRSSLTCPLVAVGKPIGFIFFSSDRPNTYSAVHVEFYQQIAGQLAVIVEKSRLYKDLVELGEIKSKFLGFAAHDLRNPLTVIRGYTRLFLSGQLGEISEIHRHVIQSMDHSCVAMLELIEKFLDITAIESGKIEIEIQRRDICELVRMCHESNHILADAKSIALELDLPDTELCAEVDHWRLQQILANLVSNALKFSYPKTTVTVGARAEGDEVHIFVADQGQGIAEEELPRVFTEFGKTSTRPTGGERSTGIGLAIVKRLVEAHGGRIWVESELGVGSTFTVALPRVK
ncbi:GAF domain-containing protein [Candidatus Sumerlaeota bacterium]|nr:GAF domain-containing protein [Candidatus Sumerlaeota bacterium]